MSTPVTFPMDAAAAAAMNAKPDGEVMVFIEGGGHLARFMVKGQIGTVQAEIVGGNVQLFPDRSAVHRALGVKLGLL